MLPLSGQDGNTIGNPRDGVDLQLTGRSTQGGRPASMHSAKGFQFSGAPLDNSGGDNASVCSSRASVAGAAGGRLGIRGQSGAMSAPAGSRGSGRAPSRNPPPKAVVSKRTPSQQAPALDLQVGGQKIR
jgi:hypothetical protein